MEIKKCTPNANIYVQEHFITTSEAEMLKIFKNSLSPINRSSYKKECIWTELEVGNSLLNVSL